MRSMKPEDILRMEALVSQPEALSYSAVIIDGEPGGQEQVITELMMRRACDMMHEEQQFPFCSMETPAPRSLPSDAQPCAMNQGRSLAQTEGRARVTRIRIVETHRNN